MGVAGCLVGVVTAHDQPRDFGGWDVRRIPPRSHIDPWAVLALVAFTLAVYSPSLLGLVGYLVSENPWWMWLAAPVQLAVLVPVVILGIRGARRHDDAVNARLPKVDERTHR